jgi:phage regulator Rha-like protein
MTTPPTIQITVTLAASKEPRVDSRAIASHLGQQHQSTFELIKDYTADFAQLGKVRFETGASPNSATGQKVRYAMLNEDQAYLLLTMSRNTPRTVALKVALIKAFRDTRLALAAYQAGTLPSFKGLQDALAAIPGDPGVWFHGNVNKLINKTAGITAGVRSGCDATHQAMLTLLQDIATKSVTGAADAHDAYKRIKDSLQPLGALMANVGVSHAV